MKVLVAHAGKHGSTAEIAEAVAAELRQAGATVDCLPADDVGDVSGYDAAIVGSAVYMGRWVKPARRLLSHHGDELASRPLWLFSTGPVGDTDVDEAEPPYAKRRARSLAVRGHTVFGGRVPPDPEGPIERAVARSIPGDARDWDEIRHWAAEVAAELS